MEHGGTKEEKTHLDFRFPEMAREESKIGLAIWLYPILASLPSIHQPCHDHWLVFLHIVLDKIVVTQLLRVQPLYLPDNFDTHFSRT